MAWAFSPHFFYSPGDCRVIYYVRDNNNSHFDSQGIYGGLSHKLPWLAVGGAALFLGCLEVDFVVLFLENSLFTPKAQR
jgi:hypothetical protein